MRNWRGKGEEGGLSRAGRYTLVVSMVCMITSCYIISLAACFRPYALTDSIADDLDGNPFNLLKAAGQVAVIVFLVSMFLHLIVFDQFIMPFALSASIKRTPLGTGEQDADEASKPTLQAPSFDDEVTEAETGTELTEMELKEAPEVPPGDPGPV